MASPNSARNLRGFCGGRPSTTHHDEFELLPFMARDLKKSCNEL